MTGPPRRPGGYRDADGVRIVDTSRTRRDVWVGAGLGCAAVAVVVALRLVLGSTTKAEPTRPAPATHPVVPAAGTRVTTAPRVEPSAPRIAPPPRGKHGTSEQPGEEGPPSMTDPGQRTGIAVFPPPGTKPVKQGIVVPEEFKLPAGDVRHYQTTDDGRQLPPILMFHPDYVGRDAQGNPVELPANRIVPPDMAPAGMPVHMLDPSASTRPSTGRAHPVVTDGSGRAGSE